MDKIQFIFHSMKIPQGIYLENSSEFQDTYIKVLNSFDIN